MPDAHADPDPLPILDPQVHARFALRDRREIVQILNEMAKRNILIDAFHGSEPAFRTRILAIDPHAASILLDAPVPTSLTEAGELICVTRLNRVKIQFSLHLPRPIVYAGHPALVAELPHTLLRLQRREYFRVATPLADPLICTICHAGNDGREQDIAVRILDLSAGGLAVAVPPEEIRFAAGCEFERCVLHFPESEPLPIRLKVRSLFAVNTPNGVRVRRAGCEFVGLSNAASARIQRYLFKLERDRRDSRPEQ